MSSPEAPPPSTTARDEAQRRRHGEIRRVVFMIFWLNLLVAVAKLAYGIWAGLLAVEADALHSFLDASANVIGLFALRLAMAPPDREHPYGHRKFETIASALTGVAIAISVFEFGKGSLEALIAGRPPPAASPAGYAVIGMTWLINVFVARYEAKKGRELKSSFLEADAAHTASDVLVTTVVLISLLASQWGIAWADPLASLLVLGVISRVAWGILRENGAVLIDRAAIDRAQVERVLSQLPEIKGCHRIRSRGTAHEVHLDLHILLTPDMTLRRAHEAAHHAESALREAFPELHDVTIHMEPDDDAHEGL